MIISRQKSFIHVAIPRTASTCINVALGSLKHPEPPEHHATIKEIIDTYPQFEHYYKFTFIRNPFDRLVSTYFEFRKNRKRRYSGKIKYAEDLLSEFDISSCDITNFRNFCVNLKNSKWVDDLFFKPQFDYVSVNGENVMDYIGRFEKIEEDWKNIKHIIQAPNLEKNLPKASDGSQESKGLYRGSCHPPYQEMYTLAEIKVVEELYHKDLEYFNYSFS